MTTPTPAELDELERAFNASTQGEWTVNDKPNDHEVVWKKQRAVKGYKDGLMLLSCSNTWLDECKGNPEFIAAAHNAFPALLAAARRCAELERERDIAISEAVKWWQAWQRSNGYGDKFTATKDGIEQMTERVIQKAKEAKP